MAFLEWLQSLPFSVWVAESDTVWGYPAILTLHTIGFGVLVGANTVVNLRLLGIGREVPLSALRALFRAMWLGLAINALTGATLFAAAATEKGTQTVFYVKLAFIAAALIVLLRIRRIVLASAAMDGPVVRGVEPEAWSWAAGPFLATASLLLWVGAITSGRLMAYLH